MKKQTIHKMKADWRRMMQIHPSRKDIKIFVGGKELLPISCIHDFAVTDGEFDYCIHCDAKRTVAIES